MDKKIAYFVKRIEYALHTDNYTDAKMYYDKAVSYVGETPEITAFKASIASGIKKAKPIEPKPIETAEISKRKTINEKAIILPVVLVGIVGYLIYFFVSVYPMHRLRNAIDYGTWYQGEVDSGWSSDGVYLECKEQSDGIIEISYRTSRGMRVAVFECEIVSGSEIVVDGRTIQVELDGDYITFSPSFVDASDRSVWRSDRDYEDDDKTGNFSDNESNQSNGFVTTDHNNSVDTTSTTTASTEVNKSSTADSSVQNNTSAPSKGNINPASKPPTSTKTTTKTTAKKDPCANGHSWEAATCTSPATCSVCKKTSGQPNGHEVFLSKCYICEQSDYRKIAGTYTDVGGYFSGSEEEVGISSFTINASGTLSFNVKGVQYSFKLVENSSDYHWESGFACYNANGSKNPDVTARANYDSSRNLIFHLEWNDFNGQELYFYGEKQG